MRKSLAPTFRRHRSTSTIASKAMAGNAKGPTRCELLLRAALKHHGVNFAKNVSSLPGKPDIVLRQLRVVVFCDGDFWHGRKWESRKRRLQRGSNSDYWIAKIEANRRRDRRQRDLLKRAGWLVLRVWETDVFKDPSRLVLKIVRSLELQRSVVQRSGVVANQVQHRC
jgi:DNA mismatch endonuclease, patch repair protein